MSLTEGNSNVKNDKSIDPLLKNSVSSRGKDFANNADIYDDVVRCLKSYVKDQPSQKPRKTDQRITNSLSEEQHQAIHKIYFGFKFLVDGTGYRTQVFSYMPPVTAARHYGPSDLTEKYLVWFRLSQAEGLCPYGIVDILIFGKSYREVDRERRKRKGYAKENLIAGLSIYMDLDC